MRTVSVYPAGLPKRRGPHCRRRPAVAAADGKILFSFISFFLLVRWRRLAPRSLLSWQLEGGAAAINDAGSLRMRTYQLGLQLRQVEQDPARSAVKRQPGPL